MTVYRAVCQRCTEFIRSFNDEPPDDWNERANEWLSSHVCGGDDGDGSDSLNEGKGNV